MAARLHGSCVQGTAAAPFLCYVRANIAQDFPLLFRYLLLCRRNVILLQTCCCTLWWPMLESYHVLLCIRELIHIFVVRSALDMSPFAYTRRCSVDHRDPRVPRHHFAHIALLVTPRRTS